MVHCVVFIKCCGFPIPSCNFIDVVRYLTVKITEGQTHHITCPGFECSMLVPVEIIEKLVSREMARRYLQFDIKVNMDIVLSVSSY